MEKYLINCTGDVVAGDNIKFTEGVFGGSYRKPKYRGDRTICATVLRESYGAAKQQHTFTLLVHQSDGYEPIEAGKTIKRKGRNIYRNGTKRQQWANESQRDSVADEKHIRGDAARADRDFRKHFECFTI